MHGSEAFGVTTKSGYTTAYSSSKNSNAGQQVSFAASRKWSGTSQSIGSGSTHNHTFTGTKNTHNHTFTGTAANHNHSFSGTSNTFSLLNPYKVAYCYRRIS